MIVKDNCHLKKYTNLVEELDQTNYNVQDPSKVKAESIQINEKEEVETLQEKVDVEKSIFIKHKGGLIAILFLSILLFIGLFSDLQIRGRYRVEVDFNSWDYDIYDTSNELVKQRIYEYDMAIMEDYIKRRNISESTVPDGVQCNKIPFSLRIDCHPENKASEAACTKRGCCWQPPKTFQIGYIPYCYYPENWKLYKYDNYTQQDNDFIGFLTLQKQSPYKDDIPVIKMEAIIIDDSILRVKISDPVNQRYEPPWPIRPDFSNYSPQMPKYRFKIDDVEIGFQIDRVTDNTSLFNSNGIGGFIFSDQFLQISAKLPSNNIYGLGEHRTQHFKLNTKWQRFVMFNRDQPPEEFVNLYGTQPFYFVIENSGNCHGVLLLNSNAMEVTLQPAPAITFRMLGGIFDMYFLLGPTPRDVLAQYSQIVGKPFLPPYWSLGFHLCRYGYRNLNETIKVWNRTRAAGIPFDTQWNDLDYMSKNNDFTYNNKTYAGLPQFIEELHNLGMHYIPLIDAGISGSEINGTYRPYDEGIRENIFVRDAETDEPFFGKVWNTVSTVWPDFTHPKAKDYYLDMMQDLHNSIPYDGAWIDMNEPSNFYDGHRNGCTHNNLNYPEYVPFMPGISLFFHTLCMDAKHHLGSHYDLHNTYGTSQAIATNYALTNIRKKRPFIISRSTWVGHGKYAGHWSGDVYSSWYDLKMSIQEVLKFNLFQIPMVGADICGFNGNSTAALCNRWMQLGAFYPFARNHNSDYTIEQDPVAMGDLVIRSSKRALTIRYWLLPYLYTLFFRAHQFGDLVARPLFFEFVSDNATYDIDTQFMWGRSLMIIPVVNEDTHVTAYIPYGRWYDLYTKQSFFSAGRKFEFDAPLDTIPLLIKGGSILPAQKPGATTTESRKNSFELLVALNEYGLAHGELYWDDGDSLDSVENKKYTWLSFVAFNRTLYSQYEETLSHRKFNDKMILGRIQIMGIEKQVARVVLNNNEIPFKYDKSKSCLKINGLLHDLQELFNLSWEYDGKNNW